MSRTRIGLFGGTFNPVHSGHLHAAQRVRERLDLDEVFLIPSYIPPHKETRDLAPAADRLEMVRLAVRELPGLTASALEVEVRETSYAILTLNKMKCLYPGAWLFFILGTDAFAEIDTWKDYPHLLDECRWIVMSRPGCSREAAETALGGLAADRTRVLGDVEPIGEEDLARDRIFFLDVDALAVSSSAVREAVRDGRSLAGLVPAAVEAYIRSHHLYLNDNG